MSYPPPRPPMIPHMPGMPPGSFPYGMMPPPIAGMMGPRPTIPLPALAVEKPPVTTVFVGNISDRAPDMMVRQMLQRCGHVVSWKRVQGVSGKLQTFGFCEFDNPEATLRCIRLLNGYEILDKKLSVKVDQKTREQLSEYLKKINANKNPKKVGGRNHMTNESASATGDMFNLEQTDENTLKDDRMVLNGFEMLMKQYASQMNEQPEQLTVSSEFVPNTNISSIPQSEMTSAELKLASMEAAAALIKEEEKKKEIPVEQSPPVSEETVAKKPKLEEKVIREKERPAPSRDRVRTPPPKSRRSPSPSSSPSVASRYDRRGQHERTRSRSPARMKRRVSPDQGPGLTEEESEEMRERKRLERRLREKELAYRERLKAWETREDKKRHDYSAEQKREKQRKKQMLKDAKKLKQFLEDYDDVKDDQSHYKGSSWERLLKQRQKELEADNKDKQRERDELDDLKRKLIEKGLSDVDDEIKRLQLEEIEKFEKLDRSSSSESEEEEEPVIPDQNKENEQSIKPPAQFEPIKNVEEDINSPMSESLPETTTTTTTNIKNENDMEDSSSNIKNNTVAAESSVDEEESCQDSPVTQSQDTVARCEEEKASEIEESPSSKSPIFEAAPQTQITSHFIARSVTIKKSTAKPSKSIQPVNQLFAEDEEEQASIQMRKNRIDSEERKRAVKKLVESIPTDRDELFAYPIDWDQLDQSLMEKRIKPWINKKIIEYIGEEEPSLTDFICSKIQQRPEADKLLEEIKVVLEEEAELFVKKMWRLIVYETESKRCGLSK